MWIGILGASALLATPAAAMIPLLYQREGELRAVLNLSQLAVTLVEPITRVEFIAPDVWRVTGARCHIDVTMIARPPIRPGLTPPRTEPRMGRRVCGR